MERLKHLLVPGWGQVCSRFVVLRGLCLPWQEPGSPHQQLAQCRCGVGDLPLGERATELCGDPFIGRNPDTQHRYRYRRYCFQGSASPVRSSSQASSFWVCTMSGPDVVRVGGVGLALTVVFIFRHRHYRHVVVLNDGGSPTGWGASWAPEPACAGSPQSLLRHPW